MTAVLARPEFEPLIGVEALFANPSAPVLVCADIAALEAADKFAGNTYVCVTWLGDWHLNDWTPLHARTLLVWGEFWDLAVYLACNTSSITKVLMEKDRPEDFIEAGWDAFREWAVPRAQALTQERARELQAQYDQPSAPPDPDPPPVFDADEVIESDPAPTVEEAAGNFWPDPIDLESLSGREPSLPAFIVPDWLPTGYATLFAGHGGVGKSGIALHLAVCMAMGLPFFGIPVERKFVKYLSCEDRENVLHWRLSRICKYEGIEIADLRGWLDLVDLVGHDTLLWHEDPRTGYSITPAYSELAARFEQTNRDVLFVDGISDTFGGNENSKIDVKRYVNALISLISPENGAVVLIGHVSKPTASGSNGTGEGYSGTTGWHNSVRARWYLYPESRTGEEGTEKTGDLLLDLQKSNLGASDQSIRFSWDTAAHMFVGSTVAALSDFERKHRDRLERAGILDSLSASIAAGVRVPTAVQGRRTTYHVLSVRPEFPESLKGGNTPSVKRFNRLVMELRQSGDILLDSVRTPDRKVVETLILKPV